MHDSDRIRQEFARQAEAMLASRAFHEVHVIERMVDAASVTNVTRVLDVGCGPGIVVEALARKAAEVVAFDLTSEMIEAARRRCEHARLHNVRYALGRAENLPFDSHTFDAVVSRLLVHHIAEPRPVLSEMARVLRPHGRMVLADITCSDDPAEADLHNALEVLRDPTHVQMRTASELKQMLESIHLMIRAEVRWEQLREFGEWLRITNAPARVSPLRAVMRALAEAGVRAGIDLRCEGNSLRFTHRWVLLTSETR